MGLHANWGLLALLGLGLALVVSGDKPIPDKWAMLNTLHPGVQQRFLVLFLALEAAGWTVVITSAKRAGTSDGHGFGLACDFNVHKRVWDGKKWVEKWLRMADGKPTWEASGVPAIIREHGFRWGGDFTTPYMYKGELKPGYDPVHADLLNVYSISKMRAAALRLAGSAAALVNFDARQAPLLT